MPAANASIADRRERGRRTRRIRQKSLYSQRADGSPHDEGIRLDGDSILLSSKFSKSRDAGSKAPDGGVAPGLERMITSHPNNYHVHVLYFVLLVRRRLQSDGMRRVN